MPDGVTVQGPDGKAYQFPKGTTKDSAIAFFKKKGIGGASSPLSQPAAPAKDFGPSPEEQKRVFPPSVVRGSEAALGFDPQKMSEAYHKEGDWGQFKELGSQLMSVHLPSIGKGLGKIGAATGAGAAIGSVVPGVGTATGASIGAMSETAIQVEQMMKQQVGDSYQKIVQGMKSKDHGKAWEGGTQLLASLGMFAAMAEKPESTMKPSTTVNGGVKLAADIAKKTGVDVNEATRVAHRASSGRLGQFIHHDAYFNQWRDSKGVVLRDKIAEATKDLHDHAKLHAQNLDKQMDAHGVGIKADDLAQKINSAFAEVEKTPATLHPRIADMLKDAKNTTPGDMPFSKVRQFGSKIGRALGDMSPEQNAVGSMVYKDITDRLAQASKDHGLNDTFERYKAIESQFHGNYGKFVNSITEAADGDKVFDVLSKSEGLTKRLTNNLSQYKLNPSEIDDALKFEKKYSASMGRKTLWKLAHGTAGGAAGTLGAYAIGAPYLPSMAFGAMIGYASTELVNAIRASRLDPTILEHIIEKTKIPGKMDLQTGKFPIDPDAIPPSASPVASVKPTTKPPTKEPPTATPEKGKPSSPPVTQVKTEAPSSSSIDAFVADAKAKGVSQEKIDELIASHKAVEEFAKSKPGIVTKVPEGVHGTGKLAQQAKTRERVAGIRSVKGSTAAGGGTLEKSGGGAAEAAQQAIEAKQAQQRAGAASVDVASMQIPELEGALKELNKEELQSLQQMRRRGEIPDSAYLDGLRYYYTLALENISERGSSGTPEE